MIRPGLQKRLVGEPAGGPHPALTSGLHEGPQSPAIARLMRIDLNPKKPVVFSNISNILVVAISTVIGWDILVKQYYARRTIWNNNHT